MEKNKNASRGTIRRSTVQPAERPRSKQAGRNPQNRNLTVSHKSKINSTSLKQVLPQFSPNLSNILRHPESQEDVPEDYFAYPLHSTAIFSGESDPNDEDSEVEIARPATRDKKQRKPMQRGIPQRKEFKPKSCSFNRISESMEMEESEVKTGNTEDVESEIKTENTQYVESEENTGNTEDVESEIKTENTQYVESEVNTGNTKDVDTEDVESEVNTGNTEDVESEINTGNTEYVESEVNTGNTKDVDTEDVESEVNTGNTEDVESEINTGNTEYVESEVNTGNTKDVDTEDVESEVNTGNTEDVESEINTGNTEYVDSEVNTGNTKDVDTEDVESEVNTGNTDDVESEINTGNTEYVESEVNTGNTKDVDTEDVESEINTGNTEDVESEINTGNTEDMESEMNTGNTKDVESEMNTGNTKDVDTEDVESEINTGNTEDVESEINTNTEDVESEINTNTEDVDTEDMESEIDTGNTEGVFLNEKTKDGAKKASGVRNKLKTVPSSQFNRASKQLKNVQSRTGAAKKPRAGKSTIRQRAVSTGTTKKSSLGNLQASNSTKQKQNRNNADASASHNRVSFHGEPSTERSIASKSYSQKRKRTSVRRPESSSSHELTSSGSSTPEAGPSSVKIRCPEGTKRLAKDLTILDVVLNEFQMIFTKYKESVESNPCKKAIDSFYTNVEEHIMETIGTVQELQDLKRKDAKVTTTFNKKRKRFLEVQKELIEQEAQLKQLWKEHAELSQRKSDFQVATQFLSDFKELQIQYCEHRNRNPTEKETYDISSFPALLVESRGILGAVKQLQNINAKLQQELDKN
ncbi:uncharacterized protein LOC103178209 [Callorhinchus milii]|uniref:uncharacterized protein LOC103178209 n=1 Tax=Callorhinchus milii TaxID=7868 RepID=UPI001C3FBCA7|nr:uncharacterized protein LOC103178209 [Callorhinchus milii]